MNIKLQMEALLLMLLHFIKQSYDQNHAKLLWEQEMGDRGLKHKLHSH